MLRSRSILLPICLLLVATGMGQMIQRKQLVISAEAGVGILSMRSEPPGLSQNGMGAGEIRFAFSYAFAPKWSMGFHYDRIGTNRHDGLTRLRYTTYLAEGCFRPWSSDRGTLECALGIGPSIAALRPYGSRLPLVGNGAAISISVRYLRMLSKTIGLVTSLDHVASNTGDLILDRSAMDPDGGSTSLRWNAQRLSAGVFVKF